jgi:hypothetical protein
MKKLSILAVALSMVTLGVPVLAHARTQEAGQDQKKAESRTIRGMVKADGDKRSFVSDEDGKSWDVDNPEILKEHTGHHVELNCELNNDTGRMHVTKVTMIEAQPSQ